MENRKNPNSSVENRRKNLCWKPENAIFKSQKRWKNWQNLAETGKHNLRFAETGKVLLEAAESWKSLKKQWKVAETVKWEKSHGKPEKVDISCGNPETDPLLPALLKVKKHVLLAENLGVTSDQDRWRRRRTRSKPNISLNQDSYSDVTRSSLQMVNRVINILLNQQINIE